jgi:hypothetical protein
MRDFQEYTALQLTFPLSIDNPVCLTLVYDSMISTFTWNCNILKFKLESSPYLSYRATFQIHIVRVLSGIFTRTHTGIWSLHLSKTCQKSHFCCKLHVSTLRLKPMYTTSKHVLGEKEHWVLSQHIYHARNYKTQKMTAYCRDQIQHQKLKQHGDEDKSRPTHST